MLFSCSIEKRLYSSGYHIEWFHSNSNPQKTEIHKEPDSFQIMSASENSDVLLYTEVTPSPSIKQEVFLKDTVIPDSPAKTDEEYVTPNSTAEESPRQFSENNIIISTSDQLKLDSLTNYLLDSAKLSFLIGLYIPIFLINIRVIKKIKRLAKYSPNEQYYLEQIKKYQRIMRWPLYFFGFCVLMALLLLLVMVITGL